MRRPTHALTELAFLSTSFLPFHYYIKTHLAISNISQISYPTYYLLHLISHTLISLVHLLSLSSLVTLHYIATFSLLGCPELAHPPSLEVSSHWSILDLPRRLGKPHRPPSPTWIYHRVMFFWQWPHSILFAQGFVYLICVWISMVSSSLPASPCLPGLIDSVMLCLHMVFGAGALPLFYLCLSLLGQHYYIDYLCWCYHYIW